MKGLMQEHSLNIGLIVRHAERLHGDKTVATNLGEGVDVASFAQVLLRARRLMGGLRGLGVGPGDRVATFCRNHRQHVEAYVAVPCLGAVLHTLNIRLFVDDPAYIVDHAQRRLACVSAMPGV